MNKIIIATITALTLTILTLPAHAWLSGAYENPLTGQKTVSISTSSVEKMACPNAYEYSQARMTIQCSKNKTRLFISTSGCWFKGSVAVRYRVDEGVLMATTFHASNDIDEIYHKNPIPMIRRMIKGDKIVMGITPTGRSERHATFDTTEILDYVDEVQEACNWK